MKPPHNPELDLVLERTIDVSPEKVWQAWTRPDLLVQWFTPKPWRTSLAEMDLRPGGSFRTVMEGPDGERFDGTSCILEVVENERLVWTSALGAGFRPSTLEGAFVFTAFIELERAGAGCKYTATVVHGDPASKRQHEEMGFYDGWGAALNQLVELMTDSR